VRAAFAGVFLCGEGGVNRFLRSLQFFCLAAIGFVSLVLITALAFSVYHAAALIVQLLFRGGRS